MLVEKEIIGPATHWYRDEATGLPRKLVVTNQMTHYLHNEGNKMLAMGLTVPVPCEHDFNAHPMTPAEKLKNNAGWVKEYRLKDVTDPKTQAVTKDVLFGLCDITDPDIAKKLPTTIRWTSPWISSFTDGQNRDWKNVISHLALTTRPRIINQAPFSGIVAALSIATVVKETGAKGYCLSKAGKLVTRGNRLFPAFPMAFSMWAGGVMLDVDSSGHSHESGKFGQVHETSGKTDHATGKEVSTDANDATRKANSSKDIEHQRHAANMHRGAAAYLHSVGEHGLAGEHEAAGVAHQHEYEKNKGGTAMALNDMPPKKKKPDDVDADPAAESDDIDTAADPAAKGDEDPALDSIDEAVGGETTPEPFADAAGDVGMEEVLADLLGALDIHVDKSPDEATFKRSLYNAAMTKIHELTAKGRTGDTTDDPNRDNPPGQPPNNQPNPLIQQEQPPMYMSLAEINKVADPTMKSIALSMYNENVKLRASADATNKKLNSLNDAKLNEEKAKRASRIQMLSKVSPRVKADLDAMVALPSMALSMGDGGAVVDPMDKTLTLLEKGLGDLPRLLTTDATTLSIGEQPTDAEMTSEQEDQMADRMARRMGAPEQKKAS